MYEQTRINSTETVNVYIIEAKFGTMDFSNIVISIETAFVQKTSFLGSQGVKIKLKGRYKIFINYRQSEEAPIIP